MERLATPPFTLDPPCPSAPPPPPQPPSRRPQQVTGGEFMLDVDTSTPPPH